MINIAIGFVLGFFVATIGVGGVVNYLDSAVKTVQSEIKK
jgi:capsular polysaccharide biosynthesis protein